MNIEQLLSRMREFDALRDGDDSDNKDTIVRGSLDRIKPEIADGWPAQVHPDICAALTDLGIPKPYRHQFAAVEKSLSGADVVMESPTASGKTLSFAVPMLDALVRDNNARALLVYPMKALAMDQREQINELCRRLPAGVRKIESWPYDGNANERDRKAIRDNPPQILMTNPEYLNQSFLAHKDKWSDNGFLKNLRYLVIDEMHEYRGFFGGNMAMLLRRFLLQLARLGASPRIFMSTATCANPLEHAKALTNREMELISVRDALRPKREFVFVNPDIPDYKHRDILRLRVERAALSCLSENMQALVFCPTKKFAEEAFRNARREAAERGLNRDKLSLFHADLNPEKRVEIQRGIKQGGIHVAFCTNALELGLDIGGLDGVILAGFPAHIMAAWQRIGRAGRGWDKDAFVLFYAMNDPIDRFFIGNLNAFLGKPFDQLVVDTNNSEVIDNHLPSLSQETNGRLNSADGEILGEAFFHRAGQSMGAVPGNFKPQSLLKLRGDLGSSFALKLPSGGAGEEDPQISGVRKFREAYIGAHFLFYGRTYKVHAHEEKAVVLVEVPEAERHLRTEPRFFTVPTESGFFDGAGFGDVADVYYGRLDILTNFTGYKLVDERTGEEKGQGGEAGALNQRNLHAFWIFVKDGDAAGIGALEQLIRVGAMFVIPADRFDAGTYSKRGDKPIAYYYENYAGGIGVAKKLFGVWREALAEGVKIARQCECKSGCPNCIVPPRSRINADIDKERGIELAEKILAAAQNAPTAKLRNNMMTPCRDESESGEDN